MSIIIQSFLSCIHTFILWLMEVITTCTKECPAHLYESFRGRMQAGFVDAVTLKEYSQKGQKRQN